VNPGSITAGTGALANDRHHFVGLTVMELAKRCTDIMARHVDMHEVAHMLFDLRRDGLVKFHASKAQGKDYQRLTGGVSGEGGRGSPQGGIPVRIQLTDKGMEEGERYMKARLTPDDMLPAVVQNGGGHTSDLEVEGGVTVVNEEERVSGVVPKPPEPEAGPPAPVQRGAEAQRILGMTVTPAGTLVPPSSQPADRATELADRAKAEALFFPEVYRTAMAERNIRDAADLLRAVGKDDMADLVAAELGHRTPLEQEVALLYEALKRRGVVIFPGRASTQEGGEPAEAEG